MDLIYMDAQRNDIGVITAYDFDMAYGDDENTFELTLDLDDHCCDYGFYIYVEHEEYGGIVDNIEVDTSHHEVKYSGRTWHGLLDSKVIQPDIGRDYKMISGDANECLGEIIEELDITDVFMAEMEASGIEVVNYQFERYVTAYKGIRQMFNSVGAKLKIEWREGYVRLSAVYIDDYSQDEEFDTSQVDFKLIQHGNPVNHLICLGQGELADRAVIHIFTDEGGGIQPYALEEYPIKDSHYILDERNKVLGGADEVCMVYDYGNADITTNYEVLTERPSDWTGEGCKTYYCQDEDGEYRAVEPEEIYPLTTYQPYDWNANFTKYYKKENDSYDSVTGVTTYPALTEKPADWEENCEAYYDNSTGKKKVKKIESDSYKLQRKAPSDWKRSYNKYYTTNGVTYSSVSGETVYHYKVQTVQPSDWNKTGCTAYYKKKNGKYVSVTLTSKGEVPKWKAKTYYTRTSGQRAPAWKKNMYYTKIVTVTTPVFVSGRFYYKKDDSPPTWTAGTYYSEAVPVAPSWVDGKFYRAVEDRYAVMVADAIEKLAKEWQNNELSIALEETDQTYDIDDQVGTTEPITGLSAVQTVTKKIIKIKNDEVSITYEVS